MQPKWQVVHSTRFSWYGCSVCASRDEGFLHIRMTEMQAALPSTSKTDEVLPRAGNGNRRNGTWSLRNGLTVFFNKMCLGYEKYQ